MFYVYQIVYYCNYVGVARIENELLHNHKCWFEFRLCDFVLFIELLNDCRQLQEIPTNFHLFPSAAGFFLGFIFSDFSTFPLFIYRSASYTTSPPRKTTKLRLNSLCGFALSARRIFVQFSSTSSFLRRRKLA